MVKKFRMLVLMTLPLYAERPMKLFSTIDFATQIGQQQLTIVMLYQSKDRDQKRAFDNFKRAAKDAEIRKAVAFLYGDLDKYDFDLVLQRYKITQFPTYMLFRTTYDEKTKESEDTLVATTVGRPLNLNGIINFIMQHFEPDISKIREAQIKQARLRAQEAQARSAERAANAPDIYLGVGWGYPYYGGYYGWGYPGWGYGYPYYGWGWGGRYYRGGGGYHGAGFRGGGFHGGGRGGRR